MCSTGPFQFRWLRGYIQSSCYYHHQIGNINLTHYHIFRCCMTEMLVTSYSVTYFIYILRKPGFCFHYYCAVYGECKYSDTFWLADRVRLLVHYTISLSSLCKLIWGHWNYKMPVRYILSSVRVRLSIFSQSSIIQYMGLCVFSLPISLVMIERIYTLSYYHHQTGRMNFYPLFRVGSWNNGMHCMSLSILLTVVCLLIWDLQSSVVAITNVTHLLYREASEILNHWNSPIYIYSVEMIQNGFSGVVCWPQPDLPCVVGVSIMWIIKRHIWKLTEHPLWTKNNQSLRQ